MHGKNGKFYEFGDFRLDAQHPSLWLNDKMVQLPPKALDLLILLVRQKGGIVSRDELLETVWRDTFVEEANINYTVSLLRKTLDCRNKNRFIQTVPKKGYRFIAEVREAAEAEEETLVQPTAALLPASDETRTKPKAARPWILLTITALAVLLLTSFGVWLRYNDQRTPPVTRKFQAVAVLPLKDLDEGEPHKILALGLTDSLISRLGSLKRFTVRPLDAVAEYKSDPLRFGEKLKTDAVLEGTLQKADNRFRVNLRLLDVRDGAQLWAGSFDEAEGDIFKLQDDLANQAAQSLLADLTLREREILAKRDTNNAEAFRAYARGRIILDQSIVEKVKLEQLEKAIDEFQKAIDLDPTFALAYAGLADAFMRAENVSTGETGFRAKAKFYAQQALALDSESADIYTSLGLIKRLFDWDWAGAEEDFKHAIRLDPNHAYAHLYYAQLLAFTERGDEALAEIKFAYELNPISPSVAQARFGILESRGDFDEALRQAEDFYRFDKTNPSARRALATFLFHKGDYARVIEIAEQTLAQDQRKNYAFLSLLATAYERIGQTEKSADTLRRLEQLAASDTKALYSLAMNYAELKREDDAMRALQKCFEQREERISWIKVEPRFANLKNDARFLGLLQKLNLTSNSSSS